MTRRSSLPKRPKGLSRIVSCALAAGVLLADAARADPVQLLHPQGWAHGFVSVATLQGKHLGTGGLLQRLKRRIVTSRLVINFFDGSVDDETTVKAPQPVLRLLSDHHVQHGRLFPASSDLRVDATHGLVRSKDGSGRVSKAKIDMPADTHAAVVSTILMHLPGGTSESTIAIVSGGATAQIAQLRSTPSGKKPFTRGESERESRGWRVQVELRGFAELVAPLIGKQPPGHQGLTGGGGDPVFLRDADPLCEGGPIWRVQQISAASPA